MRWILRTVDISTWNRYQMSNIFTQQSTEIAHLSKFIIGAIFLFNVMFFQVFDGITVVHSPNKKKCKL